MGLSLPAEKPRNFKATFKRLMRRLHPERFVIAVVLVLRWSASSSPCSGRGCSARRPT